MTVRDDFKEMKALAAEPLTSDTAVRRVEICMLKFKEEPEIIDKAISRIIHNTDHPFTLKVYDNRPNNANTSRVWNRLVKHATLPYILIIDSDAYVPIRKEGEKCWLTKMMESIDETGVVVPVSNAPGGAMQHVQRAEPYPSAVINKQAWSGYCFLFTKDAYKNIGPFDERFYIYGQDSEWAIRCGRILGGAVMRKDTLVEHIGGASFGSSPIRDKDKTYARELYRHLTKES